MTEIGRSGFTAIWFNPDGKLRDFAPGVSRFLKDAEEIVPESKGNWFIIEENSTDAEVIASAISTSKALGKWTAHLSSTKTSQVRPTSMAMTTTSS